MSLIDQSYFVGSNNISNTDRLEVMSKLKAFINNREPELLRDLLGYTLNETMKYNLSDARFIALLYGSNFSLPYNNAYPKKWAGLLTPPDVPYTATVDDATNGFLSVPVTMLEQDNIYVWLSNGTEPLVVVRTAKDRITFVVIDATEYIFKVRPKYSMIANYVFYHWLSDATTQTVGLGEVQTRAEAADLVSPIVKQVRIWNELVDHINILREFLYANADDYPEYQPIDVDWRGYCGWRNWRGWQQRKADRFRRINEFNL